MSDLRMSWVKNVQPSFLGLSLDESVTQALLSPKPRLDLGRGPMSRAHFSIRPLVRVGCLTSLLLPQKYSFVKRFVTASARQTDQAQPSRYWVNNTKKRVSPKAPSEASGNRQIHNPSLGFLQEGTRAARMMGNDDGALVKCQTESWVPTQCR